MNKQDKNKFYQAFLGVCEIFEKKFSEAMIGIYLNALENYSGQESVDALNLCARTLKWFPKPADILQAIEGDPDERALEAWDALLTAIKQHGRYGKILFQDAKIGKLVQSFGGWDQVCSWTHQEIDFRRIEFVRSYKGMGRGYAPLEISGAYSCGPLVMIGRENKGDRNLLTEYVPMEGVH